MGNIGNIWVSLGLKIDEFNKNLSAVDKAMAKVGDKFQSVGKTLAITGGAITAAMGLAIVKTANLGDEFKDLSQRTGIAVETLSSFKLAADKSGTSIDGFATGMKGLSRVMYEAASGGKEAKETFIAVGVSATDTAGNVRPLDQVMLDVADRFAGMANGAEKNALAMKLFGKAGMDLIPMLNLGRDGLQENIDKMQRFGVVTAAEAEAGDAFNDALADMQAATGGLTRTIGNALIPTLTDLATKVADAIAKVTAWAKEHPGLTKAISGTVLGIGGLLTALGTLSFAFGTVLKHVPTFIKGLNAIKAIALNPIVITIAVAIPVLKKALADFRSEFNNMRDAMQEAGSSGFISFLEGVNSGVRKVALGIKDSNIVMSEANDKFISLKGAGVLLGDVFRAVKGAFEEAVTPAAILASVFKDFGLKTKTELVAELKAAEDALKTLRGSIESTPGAVKVLEDKIADLRNQLCGLGWDTITDVLLPAIDETKLKLNDLSQINSGLGGGFGSWATAAVRAVQSVLPPANLLEFSFRALGDAMGVSAATVQLALYNIQAEFLRTIGIIVPLIESLPTVTAPATKTMGNYFDGLFNDIASGFGNTIQQWLSGATTFKNFMEGLWGNIKDSFFRMIGEMVAGWTINFVKKLITDAADVGKSIVKSISGALGGAGAAAGSMASSFLTAASSIANIVTAVASVVALLKSPPTGAGDGMGRVVERQDQQTAILGSILEFQRNDERWGWQTSIKVLENIAFEKLAKSNEYLKSMSESLKNVTKAAGGYSGVVTSPTLFVAGERGAEHVQVTPMHQSNTQPAIYITPVVIPRGDKYIIEFLTGAMRHGQMRVPAGAVGG